ncbi:MAG TPA: DUF4835 family protein [Ignavibacteria bacterium]|nr:DUF4835 family protein [Ignavibacteria bacterium]
MKLVHKIYSAILPVLIIISGFTAKSALCQDFEATCIINSDAIPADSRDRIKDFKQQVEDYLNKNKFSDGSPEIKKPYSIKLTLQFNFRGSNGLDAYDAQLFIVSQRIVDDSLKIIQPKYLTAFKYLDDKVTFTYNRSMMMQKNDVRFDSFLSLLDYYSYVALGFDEDSFYPKGGNRYFQKALDICNKPMTDRNGWTEGGGAKPTRAQLVQEMLNTRFDDFRNAYYSYHWEGVDYVYIRPYSPKKGYDAILAAYEKISKNKSREAKSFNIDLFFDEKAQEVGQLFQNYGDRSVYDRFSKWDPSHQRIFDDFKVKK